MDDEHETTTPEPALKPKQEITPEIYKDTKDYKEFLNWKKQQDLMYQ